MNKNELFLLLEKKINIALWASLLTLTITGYSSWAINTHSLFLLWINILHSISGTVFVTTIVSFGLIHFRRTLGFRRPITFALGIFAWFLLTGSCYTGLHMLLNGRTETDGAVYLSHLALVSTSVILLLAHILAYYWVARKNQKINERFPSIDTQVKKHICWSLSTTGGIFMLLWCCSLLFDPKFSTNPLAGSYVYDYGPHPFRPSQTETYHNTFIDPRQISTSSECAICHQGVTDQWMDSTHKKASSDPTYVRNINLLATKKGITATRYCEGCHAPIALLTGALSPGGFHGGQPNTHANREGVNCMSCHGIQSIEHLKGNASYKFGPGEAYLFEGTENQILRMINRLSIRLVPAQHKRDMARDFTKKSEFCATCHAQFMDKDMNNWGWVKMQDDYSAWLNGPYSGQNPRFNSTQIISCQQCHMPAIPAKDPSADAKGQVKSHRFLGANTLTAMLSESPTQLEDTIRFLQSNKMRITIDKPNRDTATQNYKALEFQERDNITAPYFYYLNEAASLNIIVSNIGVGHNFPGGTIDINEAWIELVITDAQGRPVFSSGTLDANSEVDPSAYFYRSMPVDRTGKDVWRHDLFNMIGDRYRNSIPPGAADVANFTFEVPAWAVSPLQVSATLNYRKLNKRYTAWALENKAAALPVVDMARDHLAIPIKAQPNAM